MASSRVVAERPRCPKHDSPLLRLRFQRKGATPRPVPLAWCAECAKAYPAPLAADDR